MARSATPARSSSVRRAKPPTPKQAGKSVARAAKSAGDSGPHLPTPKRLAAKAAKKAAKTMARKTVEMGASAVRRAADRAATAGRSAVETGSNRLVPIQLSIDVAGPIH